MRGGGSGEMGHGKMCKTRESVPVSAMEVKLMEALFQSKRSWTKLRNGSKTPEAIEPAYY